MTLAFSDISKVVHGQFDVSEIASAITIGRWVGSVFTRGSDAQIFEPIAAQYGLRLNTLPPWLRSVVFSRSGTILGEQQREVHAQNTIPDVYVDTIEGVATFLVLILRFTERVEEIVTYIEELLKGHFGLVFGGYLETIDPETGQPRSALPFSVRDVLRTFTNAIIDADAASPQSNLCQEWMSQLMNVIGSSKFLDASTRYPIHHHRQMLVRLLGKESSKVSHTNIQTFAAGCAMIALAARANGANVQVECITESGKVTLPLELIHSPREKPFLYLFG